MLKSFRDWYNSAAIWITVAVGIVIIIPSSVWLGYRLNYNSVYEEYATNQAYTEAKTEFERRCSVLTAHKKLSHALTMP